MCAPSGDHTGLRSWTPEVAVRLRAFPFSAGSVRMSPLASNAARTPVGDSEAARIMRRELLELRARPREVGRHLDREPPRLLRRRVEQMDVAGLFVDDRVRARRGAHDVEVVVTGELRELRGSSDRS